MTRLAWLTVLSLVLSVAPSAAQVEFTYNPGDSGSSAQANRFTDLNPVFCTDTQPPDRTNPPLSISSTCSANRAGEIGGSADAATTGSFVVAPSVVGTAANGKPLISALTATVVVSASAETTSLGDDQANKMQAQAQSNTGGRFFFKGTPNAAVTIALDVSGDPPFGLSRCNLDRPTGETTLGSGGIFSVSFGCQASAEAAINSAGSRQHTATLTITFGAAPSGAIVWVEPTGGDYDDEDNWQPPQVPQSSPARADTAVFNLANTYPVNVSGARAKRLVIRNSSIDLGGGTAEATSSSPTEPSLVIGANGKLHLISGTLTTVDSVLGDVSGGLAEVDLIAGTPTWSNSGRLTIGDAGPGRLTVVAGAVTSAESRIGGGLLGAGEAIVGGPGAWTTGNLGLGFGGGPGTLEIKDGGLVTTAGAVIGVAVSEGNRVLVSGTATGGAPSRWDLSAGLEVGGAGLGELEIRNSGVVTAATLKVAALGDVTINRDAANGEPATLDVSGTVTIAGGTTADGLPRGVSVGGGTALTAGSITVEDGVLTGGNVVTGPLVIQKDGAGVFNLRFNGGPGGILLALGDVTVDGSIFFGPDSIADLQGGLIIGSGAAGSASAGSVMFEEFGGTVTASIANGVFLGDGTLSIEGGPTVTVGGDIDIGTGAGAGESGQVFVDDPDDDGPSTLTVTQGKIAVGVLGPGQLVVSEGSTVATPALAVGGGPAAPGRAFVRDATLTCTGDMALADQALGAISITGGPRGTGLVVGGGITIGTALAGGAIFLTDGGKVSAANGITVKASSSIAGNGTVTANVTVATGGEIEAGVSIVPPAPAAAPENAPQQQKTRRESPERSRAVGAPVAAILTLTGDLTVSPGGTVRLELDGTSGDVPALLVAGAATLGGTLEIAFVNGFVPRAGDTLALLEVLGTTAGAFDDTIITGLPPGWKGEITSAGGTLGLTVAGDYLCYQTAAAKGFKLPKGQPGVLAGAAGPLTFGITKPTLLCNPSGPSTGSQQANSTQLRGYTVTDLVLDPLQIAGRTLRVTNGLHPAGELVVDTAPATLILAAAAKCLDVPPGTCPTDLVLPQPNAALVCAAAKRNKRAPAFPKSLVASAVDTFGEPRTYKLSKPTRVCAPLNGDLSAALACYAAKPLGKVCSLAAPANAASPCKSEPDCGGTKRVTTFCGKQAKHAKIGTLVLASELTRDRAATVKPLELCVPSQLQ